MSQKPYQRYNQDFKDKAVASLGLGKPVQEVAQELRVSTTMLYAWRNQSKSSQLGSAVRSGRAESSAPPCHPAGGRERHFKKAAIILGTLTPKNSAQ